jgi:uncharacterized membrane protein
VTIDEYLAELERLLPRSARRRALAEIREHLRDAAARHRAAGSSSFQAEEEATREFGSVRDVARRFASELAVRETRIATVLALGAVAFFVFPLYVIPENSLPPATWAEVPRDIHALQRIAIGCWLLAGVLAATAGVLAWTRWPRFSWLALFGTASAVAGSIAVTAVVVARWFAVTSATPNWALAAPLALACVGVCAGAALWARSSRRRLLVQD